MKKILNKNIILIALIQIFYCSDNGWTEPISVFVSIIPQKYFVERIGGNEVNVHVMVKAGESPATFNPNPKKMSRLANTSLYFSIGVPFEKIWLSRIKAIQPSLKLVPLNNNLPMIIPPGYQGSKNSFHEKSDPHIWTSPPLAKIMAIKIKDALSRESPQKADFFKKNYTSLAKDLEALHSEIRNIIAAKKTRSFMVFHPAWSYFAETYGLEQIAIEHQGKEPGPKALQKIVTQAKKLKIRVIFVQKQFGLLIAQKIAKMIGATVQEIDPLSENYFENMRQTAKAISGANH